jgi:zinc transport system substrate-binding protein
MLKKLLVLLISVIGAFSTQASQIKVITSISPLASIVAMIGKDKVAVSSICDSNKCPHHYFMRPNQAWHFRTADLIFYIDDHFEIFMKKPIKESHAKIIQMSLNSDLKILVENNWHVWLNFDNIKAMMSLVLYNLIEVDPFNKEFYEKNYNASVEVIEMLQNQLNTRLANLHNPILLDSSLEYFFSNVKNNNEMVKLYTSANKMNPDKLEIIKDAVSKNSAKCIFISSHQNNKKFQEMFGSSLRVIGLETESWTYNGSYQKMLKQKLQNMIDSVANCV